ncbi:hypothetical protein DHEL01_v207784 [Diaporthe helianthi]|uniref:Uncharacterized protein n=1 Tax=Diaporthe helianthi TaxID=158607 RepID=A0A2P5HU93_DIAHE|nr:hypothetical protein DHEL01_v207784 [Diaporthe helianthi]
MSEPHKVPSKNDRRLGKAARATHQVYLGEEVEPSWIRREEKRRFETWGPVEAAEVEHLQALQEAVGAAQKAEDLARFAEKAADAASSAITSPNENIDIKSAEAARNEAELAALEAKQKAQIAADKEEAAEALRAETRARLETQLIYKIKDRKRFGLVDKVVAVVHSPCRFRESIEFIQSTFKVSSGSFGEVLILDPYTTRHAPASAINFTEDDAGRTFGIYWPTNAPTDIATDPQFSLDVQKIRSFVTAWGKGKKACYGQNPFSDMPSIDIVICITHDSSAKRYRAVLSLCIANKELWKQGLYYKGIHIGTKDDKITSEFDWWSYGRPEMHGSPIIDTHATPIPSSILRADFDFARGLVRATLRSVEERVQPLLAEDLKNADPVAVSQYRIYQQENETRAILKYGYASVQQRLIKTSRERPDPQWAPPWEIMFDACLDHDVQTLDPRGYQMRSIMYPNDAPEPANVLMRSIMSPETAPHGSETEEPLIRRVLVHGHQRLAATYAAQGIGRRHSSLPLIPVLRYHQQ